MTAGAVLDRLASDKAITCRSAEAAIEAIRQPGCALALWRRSLPSSIEALLPTLSPDAIDDVSAEVPIDGAPRHIAGLLDAAGYPRRAGIELARDMAMLATCHANIHGDDRAKLRLEWIETDGCRRFHADAVTTRLLVTYLGRGTQWRHAGDDDSCASSAKTGDVLLLKGRKRLPEAPILHRSPPLAGSGERRLLLVIDAADFGE